MDPRLKHYYEDELGFIRESAAEFAREYPKIARRLALEGQAEGQASPDPHVERLLEGFAFLAARIQLKLNARYPQLCQQLLQVLHPQLLAPLPSATIVELQPDTAAGALQAGYVVSRGSVIQGRSLAHSHTACRFHTAHEVTLRPIEIAEVRYLATASAVEAAGVVRDADCRAGIRIRLRVLKGFTFAGLPLDELTFHLTGAADVASRLHEQLIANTSSVSVLAVASEGKATPIWRGGVPYAVGLKEEEALLPASRPSFRGYRLLQEYVMLPERFRFVRMELSLPPSDRANWTALDLVIQLCRSDTVLERRLAAEHVRLHCVPAVNLFRRSVDRLRVDPAKTEHHIVVDRNRPLDYEIYAVDRVTALRGEQDERAEILPVYALNHGAALNRDTPWYTVNRQPRVETSSSRQFSSRGRYVSTECFVAFSRLNGDPALKTRADIDIEAWCTNRDLPLLLGANANTSQFTMDGAAPVSAVRCLVEPSFPRASLAFGDTRDDGQSRQQRDISWRLVSFLSLNHLALSERGPEEGAQVLRELLALHVDRSDPQLERQVEGIRRVEYVPIVARLPGKGPIAFGRGLGITILLDEERFDGTGLIPIGAVLEQLLARQVSLNSCIQVTLKSTSRGEIKQWPVRLGEQGVL